MPVRTAYILGSESLLGRELREQLNEHKAPLKIELVADIEQAAAVLTQRGGEPVVIPGFDPAAVREADLAFFAGSPSMSRQAYDKLEGAAALELIDLTGALEDQPNARVRAPMVEDADSDGKLHVIAHPAAIAIGLFLRRLHRAYTIRHAILHVLEPASARGQSGIEELQQQTTALLSFRPLEKKVFDAQLSFNVLPRYGSDAPDKLEDVELQIERHLASLLAPAGIPLPSIRLIQVPVFHGYGISAWIEFERMPGSSAIGQTLASTNIDIPDADLDPPTNAGTAGQSGISVALIEPDRSHPRAVWLWTAFDNFRLTVDNAILVARKSWM